MRQQWRHRIANLMVLLCARAFKEIIVRKRLQSCRLAHSEAAALSRVVVNEIMAVLGNMRRDGGCGAASHLHAESVIEFAFLQSRSNIFVIREQRHWKVVEQRRTVINTAEGRYEKVTVKILADV